MTTAALLLGGLGCYAVAAAFDVLGGVRRAALRPLPYLLGAVGALLTLVSGARAVSGRTGAVDLGTFLGFGTSQLRIDPLAGLFLTVTGAVAVAVSLGFASWVGPVGRAASRGLGAAYALTLASVAVIVTADNAFVFLFGWEALTVAFYLLSGYERTKPNRADASFLTVAIGKVSGALLLVGFLLLAGRTGSFAFADWTGLPPSALHGAAYALLVAGFGAKVGLIPLQIWMPSGYSAAAGPARALMAGVAVNVGFYGMWRFLAVLGRPPLWLAIVLLVTAAITALLGVAHAAVETDLPRVIAYSSVENGGLIVAGFAVALVGATAHSVALESVGLLAGTLQLTAHAFAKCALFLSTGTFEAATGARALEELRGVGRSLPWSGTAFGVGALTLAGLPPTLGFASEWFLLEALMQQFRLPGLAPKLAMAFAGALVALTTGFAVVAFVRVLGLCVLGSVLPRGHGRRLTDAGPIGRAGLLLLIAGCVGLAAISPLEVRFLSRGLAPVVPAVASTGALKSPWVLQPVFADFSILSPSWLSLELPALLTLVFAGALLLSRGSLLRVRRVPAWRSATAGVSGEDRYTPFGYANPTRKVLANVLLTRTELGAVEQQLGTGDDEEEIAFAGPDMPPGEQSPVAHHGHLSYHTNVVELVEAVLYRPLLRPLRAVVHTAKRLQSGRLDAYIAYMLITLVALLAVVTALA